MNNISKIHDCYGCGVCTISCSKHLIKMRLNINGFYEPYIEDLKSCTDCGLCISVCAFNHKELANKEHNPLESYGAWSRSKNILNECSSGGIGFEIGRIALENGYKVCSVKYNSQEHRAEHYIAQSLEELNLSKGSKYIQSYTPTGFKNINRKEKNIIFGTPCQIDSMRHYIRKFRVEDNFVLVDFFCHSVPSLFAWRKYLSSVEKEIGKSENISWRSKETGWHDSYTIKIKGSLGLYKSWRSKGDIFYKLFLGDFCCGKACQKACKYKYDKSSADLRIGDAWGKTYENNNEGVSALIVFTPKGKKLALQLKKNCTLEDQPFSVIAEGQMTSNVNETWTAPIIHKILRSNYNIPPSIWNKIFAIDSFFKPIHRKLQYILKKWNV